MKKRFLVFVVLLLLFISGCGNNSSSRGSISFGIDWRGDPSTVAAASGVERAPIDCTTSSVYQVKATIYDAGSAQVATGGPWACTQHSGSITNVPAGTGLRIEIIGLDTNGETIAFGEKAGLTVSGGGTTNAGTIPVSFITTLASGLLTPYAIAVDSSNIYWSENNYSGSSASGYIKSLPLSGGTPTTLAAGLNHPMALVVDSVNVYWTDTYTVSKVPISGGTPTTLASGILGNGLAVDSANVYFIDQQGSELKRVPISGGTATTLAALGFTTGSNFDKVVVDPTGVYWSEIGDTGAYGSIRKTGLSGGAITILASGLNAPMGLAIDSTNVYWFQSFSVQKIPITGGTVTPLASACGSTSYVNNIATDSTNVYWVDQCGYVRKTPVNGGPVTTLAPATPLYYGNGITVDSTYVYWTETKTGKIRRVAK